ncbi:sialin-like [Littorina saxatilis]|uniref:sialin-like n=1 Tax=Littorina saxatilis TaxID=31220 RepID=UPI0038B49159
MTAQDKETLVKNGKTIDTQGPTFGARHSLILWAFFALANLFALRVDMSIALVAMAKQTSTTVTTNTSLPAFGANETICEEDLVEKQLEVTPEFDWSNTMQGFVLSAFYYGYFATQIPGSLMARRLGGKNLISMALAGSAALALLTPLSARLHVGVLIAVRVLQGCLQGIVFPAVTVMFSKWVPHKERSRLVAFSFAGCQAGTVVGLISAGYICDSVGWPVVFYIEGGLGLICCAAWMLLIFDTPSQHSRITELERRYIESSVDRSLHKEPTTPWRSILTSPALYGIMAAHVANDWGCFAVMTCLPKFMKDILKFDMTQNGVLSSLPYLVTWVCNLVAGSLADCLRKPGRLRTVHVRKLMVTIGLIGPGSLLLGAAYLPGCGRVAVIVLLTIAMGFSGFTVAGHSCNHLDIAPPFAGIMFAMTNTVGTTTGFIGPAVAGALTDHDDTRQSWQTFFLISGAVYAVGGIVFVLFARGDVQPWAKVGDLDSEVIINPPLYGSIQAGPSPSDEEDEDERRGRYYLGSGDEKDVEENLRSKRDRRMSDFP